MKIAITGASGHLGSVILQELLKRNHQINALAKDNDRYLEGSPIEIIYGDLLDSISLQKMMNDCEVLIHCAAVISINGDPGGIVYRTNVEGTKLVMQTAKKSGIKRVIHISSIHAYEQQPMFETLDENRRKVNENAFAYDRSKKLGQEIALSMNQPGMEVIVMNPTSIVGPNDHQPSKVGKVLIDLYTGRLPFIFDGGFDFCDCRDVAKAIVNGLTMGRPGENYLLSGKWYSLKQIAEMISKITGEKINPIALPLIVGKAALPFVKLISWLKNKEPRYTIEALEALFTGNRCINSAKAMNELNYKVRPFEETVRDAFLWFENKSYLV